MPEKPLSPWTEVKRFVQGGIAVSVEKREGFRPAYSVRVGRVLPDGRLSISLPMQVEEHLAETTLVPFLGPLASLLQEAEAWLTEEVLVHGLAQLERRQAREREQVDHGKPVTRVTGKTAKKKAKMQAQKRAGAEGTP